MANRRTDRGRGGREEDARNRLNTRAEWSAAAWRTEAVQAASAVASALVAASRIMSVQEWLRVRSVQAPNPERSSEQAVGAIDPRQSPATRSSLR